MAPRLAPAAAPAAGEMVESNSASAAAQRSLGSGWTLSCTASGPQLHGSLGSTGLRPMPPYYSRDLEHGPGVGLGLLPWLLPPTCSRPVSGLGLGLFVMRLPCCGLPAPARQLFFGLRSTTVCHETDASLISCLPIGPLAPG